MWGEPAGEASTSARPALSDAPSFDVQERVTPEADLGDQAPPEAREEADDEVDAPQPGEADEAPEVERAPVDADGDGVPDEDDNCPQAVNPSQCDLDGDGVGDACVTQEGSWGSPLVIPTCPELSLYLHSGDTCEALSDEVDSYPPAEQPEAGGEIVYLLKLDGLTEVSARLEAPEPEGVDVDIHILASLSPLVLVDRGHREASAILEAGTYYIVADTYGADDARCGPYALEVVLTPRAEGSIDDPVVVGDGGEEPLSLPFWYEDTRDTSEASSDSFDSYPPNTLDQSGNEVIYRFTVAEEVRLAAVLRTPEPEGVDVDLHLLGELEGPSLIARGDRSVYAILEPGTYFLIADTYVDSSGVPQSGAYHLSLSVRRRGEGHPVHFNPYVLAAVDYLYANYGLLGYDSAALTHDLAYADYGTIFKSGGQKTMCVAGMLEVIIQAMTLYGEDTGDWTPFDYLPLSSWTSLHSHNIKAHIWVNHELESWGTPDALRNFEMGEVIPFEELEPGAFLNLNRVNGTGHAVVFIAYIDMAGNTYASHNKSVVGFKYFSAQGGYEVGAGGLDYRYALFDDFGKPPMPYKRDSGVILTDNQRYLNTGAMFMPDYWGDPEAQTMRGPAPMSAFDPDFFSGDSGDDDEDYTPRSPRWRAP